MAARYFRHLLGRDAVATGEAAKRAADFEKVLTLRGRQRRYFSTDGRSMTEPRQIPDSGIYAKTCFSANDVITRCHEVIELFGHSREELEVEVEDRH